MIIPDTSQDFRKAALERWLARVLGTAPERVEPASADASFRRYFRVWRSDETWVAMDAPPDKEDLLPYLRVAQLLAGAGVNVPRVVERDLKQGFLLLTDLGSRQYLDALLAGADADALYADALSALLRIQIRGTAMAGSLPPYDETRLRQEMSLFPEWFVGRHLGLELGDAERVVLEKTFHLLARSAMAQPQVLVHRDFHSRNLMVCDDNPGILDFQDAVVGALSYDSVSLLKDCYVDWPRERVLGWLLRYRAAAAQEGLQHPGGEREFVRAFDLMGVQRHLKVLGIFARLWYRDGKAGYIADLPRVLDYTLAVTGGDAALGELDRFLRDRVLPAFGPAQSRVGAGA